MPRHKTQVKIYIASRHKKQTTMHSGKQIKPLTLFNEFYDEDTGQTDRQTVTDGHQTVA